MSQLSPSHFNSNGQDYFHIKWPDGRQSVSPIKFLEPGEKISVEMRDSSTDMTKEEITRWLNRIAAELERQQSRRQVQDSRALPTLDQRAEEAADFEQKARRLRQGYRETSDEKPRPCRTHMTDAEAADDFVTTAKRFHRKPINVHGRY